MVNQNFVNYFGECIQKELGGFLAGPPAVMHGGVAMDHYKGLSSRVASSFVPFMKESYTPSEFLYGWIPLQTTFPYLYFQIPCVDIKGDSIPGVGQFAAVIPSPIPETIITPMVGLTNRYLSFKAVVAQEARAKDVFKNKVNWNPMLEAMNNDKPALKANTPKYYEATMGRYKVSVDVAGPIGLTQLAPYKGYTIITAQAPPALRAGANKPFYTLADVCEKFQTIGGYVTRFPQRGEDVGEQIVTRSNATMMDLVFQQLDEAAPAARPPEKTYDAPPQAAYAPPTPPEAYAPPAAEALPPPPASQPQEQFPCPTCGGNIRFGFRFCPNCKQELVWG